MKTDLQRCPRLLKYKKLQRGSFKLIRYRYNKVFDFPMNKRVFGIVACGVGMFRWKCVLDFQKRIGRIFKKKKSFKLRFNFSMNWSISHKTHKSRMGKGKGVISLDDWRTRIKGGKCLFMLQGNRSSILSQGIRKNLWRNSLMLPVSITIC